MSQPAGITVDQLVGLLDTLDIDKVRDDAGAIDPDKVAAAVAALTPEQGPTVSATRRTTPDSNRPLTGREMFEARHKKTPASK